MFKDKGREITQEDIYNECYPPIDSNKLIAEFMGFPTQTDVIDDRTLAYYIGDVIDANNENNENDDNVFHPDDMQFHTSWDWLMPVIRRIRDHVNIDMSFEEYDDWRENFKEIDPYNYSLEQCYTAVVEFINEYNKNN